MQSASSEFGISPQLLHLVGLQESQMGGGLDKNLQGDSGHGNGIWQLDDQRRPGATPRDPAILARARSDPQFAARVASAMLKRALDQTGGDVRKALSIYNSGSATSATGLAYADQVLARGR